MIDSPATDTGYMLNVFNSAVMKSSMSSSCILLMLSEAVRGRRERPLAVVCLVPGT
jgi:hypothetical protein